MTTIVTVKTHQWPVAVETQSYHNYSYDRRAGYGNSNATEFMPADSERRFTVTNTTSVTVRELPEGATGLNYPQSVPGPCLDSIQGLKDSYATTACNDAVSACDAPDKARVATDPYTRAAALEAAIRTTPQELSDSVSILKKAGEFGDYLAGQLAG